MSAADSIGVEKVEKNSAIAVTSISSTRIRHDGLEQRGIERRRVPGALRRGGPAPGHVGEHGVERHGHHREVHGERQHQAGVLAEHELMAVDRLGEQAVDAAPLDFLRDQADADEHGDEQAEDRRRREAEILDDLDVLPGRELADQVRRAHQEDREEDEVVEHLVAHRLAEDVDRDRSRWLSRRPPGAVVEPATALHLRRGHLLDEEILERLADRIERHEVRAAADELGEQRSGGGSSGSSSV